MTEILFVVAGLWHELIDHRSHLTELDSADVRNSDFGRTCNSMRNQLVKFTYVDERIARKIQTDKLWRIVLNGEEAR